MKKRAIFVAVAIAAFSATLAISHAVNSQNWVGYAKVQVPPAGQFTMVGVNFEAVGGGGVPLNELISTNSLTSGMLPSWCSRVYIFDPVESSYNSYYYQNGTFNDMVEQTPTNPVVGAGTAFWLRSSDQVADTNEVYIMGQVLLEETNTSTLVEGFQQVSNPYATDFNINSNALWSTATGDTFPWQADRLYVWNGSGYEQYYLNSSKVWCDPNSGDPVADVEIPVGGAAWYRAKAGFTNVVERPFQVN